MKKKRTIALALLMLLTVLVMPGAQAEGKNTIDVPFHVTLSGDTPANPETFIVVFEALDAGNPMPAQTRYAFKGAGKGSTGNITFDRAGDFDYRLYQEKGNATGYTYDDTVYDVHVQVVYDIEGDLQAFVTVTNQEAGVKPYDPPFNNHYKTGTNIPQTGYGTEWEQMTGAWRSLLAMVGALLGL